jgi:hypothetical protein
MKPSDLPKPKPRADLESAPPEQDLIAVSEEMKTDKRGKPDCLYIVFQQRDGKVLTQKYTDFHTDELLKALKELKLEDTTKLQENWYRYKQVGFSVGNPRYIPVKKL